MSIFHSTVTRRDFMKGIGLTGAALGAAGMVAPVYHDMDEVLASETSWWKRPWYIKEREHDNHNELEIGTCVLFGFWNLEFVIYTNPILW